MHGKRVFRVLGLSLMVALGAMAFAAVGAQGANLELKNLVHGEIKVLGKVLHASVTAKAEGPETVLVPALGIEKTCSKFTVISGLINQTAAKGHGEATILFEECKVYAINAALELISKTVPPTPLPCQPLDSEKGTVGHIRAKALFLVVLHEEKDYLVIEDPNLVPPMIKIIFTPGLGCAIPLKPEMKGSLAFEITTGDLHGKGVEVKEALIKAGSKTVQELLGAKLLYGANEAFLDGSAVLKLVGAHEGCAWGVL